MANVNIEQEYPDPAYVKNIILSALGQDPQHDFYEGSRTYDKSGECADKGIAGQMIKLLNSCKAIADIKKGGSKLYKQKGGDGEDTITEIVLRGSLQEIQLLADETVKQMVNNITNNVFANGISLALYATSVYSQNIFGDNNDNDTSIQDTVVLNDSSKIQEYSSTVTNDVRSILAVQHLQSDFIDSAKTILTHLNDITTLDIVDKFYKTTLLNALNDPLNNNISEALTKTETDSYNYLMNQVSEVLQGSNNVCVYNLNSAMSLVNSYAQQVGVPLIQPDNFISVNKEEQTRILKSIKKKILLKIHPDKVSPELQSEATELFTKVEPDINNLINSCFETGNLLDNDNDIMMNDDEDDDIDMMGGKGGPKKETSADKCEKASELNNIILHSATKFMMIWLGCAKYKNPGVTTEIEPIFHDITKSPGGKQYLKSSPVTGKMVNPGRIQLNAQILILFLHVTNGTNLNSILDKSGIGSDLSNIRNHMDILSLPAHLSIWLGGPETGLHKIDNQTQEAHNIIIRTYFPEMIYQDNDKNYNSTAFPLPQIQEKFVVNNAAIIKDTQTVGQTYSGRQIKDHVFCPIASLLDGMKPCSIPSALKKKTDALYPMNYVVRDTNGRYTYTVSYQPVGSDKNGHAILTASLSRFGDDRYLFRVDKNLKYDGKDLTATEGYRSIITELNKLYNIKAKEGMRLRYDKNTQDKDNAIFMDFMQKVMGDAIGNFAIKSIGDYAQEGTVTSKYSAVSLEGDTPENISVANITPTDNQGDSFRLGIANDRPSAYRMVDQLLYSTDDTKNLAAIVGYYSTEKRKGSSNYGKQSEKNFLVHAPRSSSSVNSVILDTLSPKIRQGGKPKKKTRKRKYKKRKTNKRKRRKKKTKRRKSTRKTKRKKRKN